MKIKTILFLIVTLIYSCQASKLVTKKSNGHIIEKYHILRSGKNLKHGEYNSYYIISRGNSISTYPKEKGKYSDGNKVGIWLTYRGEIINRYDFDNNEKLKPEINVSLNYPEIAKERGIQGTVTISYTVKSDCSISEIKILKSISPECDKEVIRVVKRISELSKKHNFDCKEEEVIKEFKFLLAG